MIRAALLASTALLLAAGPALADSPLALKRVLLSTGGSAISNTRRGSPVMPRWCWRCGAIRWTTC